MTEVRTAQAWGMVPSAFWKLGETEQGRADQAYMIALARAESRMLAWEAQQREEGFGQRPKGGRPTLKLGG